MQAPKNGFLYVIDRTTGKVISAAKIGKVTWADHIDLATGRPVEEKNIRYEKGNITIWPATIGAHNWQTMSFDPKTGLVYIPYMPTRHALGQGKAPARRRRHRGRESQSDQSRPGRRQGRLDRVGSGQSKADLAGVARHHLERRRHGDCRRPRLPGRRRRVHHRVLTPRPAKACGASVRASACLQRP